MKQTYETGLWGEDIAAQFLQRECGMFLLKRRYRAKCGEIDLIMQYMDIIVFVEVKTRKTGDRGSGLSAVNTLKQKRILNAALIYLMEQKWTNRQVRFDLVEIHGEEILHVPNAFQPYGRYYH